MISKEDEAKKGITRRGSVKGAIALGGASVVAVGGYAALETLTQEEPPTLQETFLYLNPGGAMVPVWVVERGLVGEEARRAFEREHDLPPLGDVRPEEVCRRAAPETGPAPRGASEVKS